MTRAVMFVASIVAALSFFAAPASATTVVVDAKSQGCSTLYSESLKQQGQKI